jgi:transcriptional regulator with XRE-family HTH domain
MNKTLDAFAQQMGHNIRRMRKAQGKTQRKLAYDCGITFSTLNRIEMGHGLPLWETLARLAEVLGCEIQDILSSPANK